MLPKQNQLLLLQRKRTSLFFICIISKKKHKDVFFTPQPKYTSVKQDRCWNNHLTFLGRPSCNNLLLMHAVSGSDTTSSLHDILYCWNCKCNNAALPRYRTMCGIVHSGWRKAALLVVQRSCDTGFSLDEWQLLYFVQRYRNRSV